MRQVKQLKDAPDLYISIHAPVKGATLICRNLFVDAFNFNPRTREGCDDPDDITMPGPVIISIHAPVKGATVLIT